MELRQIVDDAHALASFIEDGDTGGALERAESIALVALATSRLEIAEAARQLVAALHAEKGIKGADWWPALNQLANALGHAIEMRSSREGLVALDMVQVARHANLRAVLYDLRAQGVAILQEQARVLHVGSRFLDEMLAGAAIPEVFAREVELVCHKRTGWMDDHHS